MAMLFMAGGKGSGLGENLDTKHLHYLISLIPYSFSLTPPPFSFPLLPPLHTHVRASWKQSTKELKEQLKKQTLLS